jgi:hypothetical protein
MYARLCTLDTIHKKNCNIGPGLCRTSENSVYANFGECPECELRRISIPRTSVNKDIQKAERPGLDARSPARFYDALTVLSQRAPAAYASSRVTAITVVAAASTAMTKATGFVHAPSPTAKFAGGAGAAKVAAILAEEAESEWIADTAAALNVGGAGAFIR